MTRYHDCSPESVKLLLGISPALLAEASYEVCKNLKIDKTDTVIRDHIEEMIVEKIGKLINYNLPTLITVDDKDDITRPK